MASGDSKFKTTWYWFSTLLVWGSIVFLVVAYVADMETNLKYAALGIAIACLLAYYISEFCSSSCSYLCNKSEAGSIYSYMEQMFYTPVHKVMHIQCYHYELRTVTTRDANGKTKTQLNRVRVNTRFATERYYYISWRDISGKFDLDVSGGMAQHERPFVKLHLLLAMSLAEDGTASDFHYQKRSFIARNNWDTHYDFTERLELNGYNEHTLVKVTDFNPPCFNSFWFFLFTLLTVVEFYKIHMDKYCIVQDFNIVKVVSSRQDLNAPQYIQQYLTLTPCIVYMGNIQQYNGPMLLPQGELVPPPPAENMPANVNPMPVAGEVQMNVPMDMNVAMPGMDANAPLLPNA